VLPALACLVRVSIVPVHGFPATVDALKVWQAAEQGAVPT
ncbi:dihydropteroate synthase, partial [Bordetella bronchiseptica]